MDAYWFQQNDLFRLVVQIFAMLILAACIVAMGFAANSLIRRKVEISGDRNWKFLFSCWSDSVVITVLFGASGMVYLFEDSLKLLQITSYSVAELGDSIRVAFVVWSVQVVLHALILIIAIRLVLKIRAFLEERSSSAP